MKAEGPRQLLLAVNRAASRTARRQAGTIIIRLSLTLFDRLVRYAEAASKHDRPPPRRKH